MTFSTLISEFKETKDPTIISVMVKYSAVLLGITIATFALALSQITGNTSFGAYDSLAIGLVLMVFAFFLVREKKDLSIGESISKREYKEIIDTVSRMPEVNRIISLIYASCTK